MPSAVVGNEGGDEVDGSGTATIGCVLRRLPTSEKRECVEWSEGYEGWLEGACQVDECEKWK